MLVAVSMAVCVRMLVFMLVGMGDVIVPMVMAV
jgi:hypothetical protein